MLYGGIRADRKLTSPESIWRRFKVCQEFVSDLLILAGYLCNLAVLNLDRYWIFQHPILQLEEVTEHINNQDPIQFPGTGEDLALGKISPIAWLMV